MSKNNSRGFSIIEVIIFIVVVGIGLTGALSVFNNAVKASADPLVTKQAYAIADSLVEEISLKSYNKPSGSNVLGFSSGGTRTSFDCVDDYNNYTSAQIIDGSGSTVSGLTKYSIAPAVSVSSSTVNGLAMKKITVYVTTVQGVFSTSVYRGSY